MVAYDSNKVVIHDFTIEIYRKPEEPLITVFFSRIVDGLRFEIKRKDINIT